MIRRYEKGSLFKQSVCSAVSAADKAFDSNELRRQVPLRQSWCANSPPA